jgi:hypothetical protein
MPRYVIESLGTVNVPVDDTGAGNRAEQVTWLGSYVSRDQSRTFCVCDGPSPEAITRAAASNRLPVARITEVQLLDP